MTYAASTLTSANPAADLYTALASSLTTAGFTLVDTVVIGSNTHKVWKSAAANNTTGLDWYLDVAYVTTGAGNLWLGAFEGYDNTTHKGLRGPYNAGVSVSDGNASDATYGSRYGTSDFELETNWTHVSRNHCMLTTSTSNFAYWWSVTGDRVIAMTSLTPTFVGYCGFYTPHAIYSAKFTISQLYPLVTATISPGGLSSSVWNQTLGSPNASTSIAFTRRWIPQLTQAGFSQNWASMQINPVWNVQAPVGLAAPAGRIDAGSQLRSDGPRGASLQFGWLPTGSYDDVSSFIGYLCPGSPMDVLAFNTLSASRGDTVTISSATWVVGSQVSNTCVGFKAV